jgi:hypothetical protein
LDHIVILRHVGRRVALGLEICHVERELARFRPAMDVEGIENQKSEKGRV